MEQIVEDYDVTIRELRRELEKKRARDNAELCKRILAGKVFVE